MDVTHFMKLSGRLSSVALLSLIFMTLGNFDVSAYSPLAPFIKSRFQLSSAELGLITSIIFAGSFVMSSLAGFFVDRIGKNSAIKISFALMAAGSLTAAISKNYIELVSGFFIIGFGYGIVTPSTNSLVMSAYYPRHARAMGIKQSGVPLGAAIAAVSLPLIAIHLSLEAALFVIAAVSLIVSLLVKKDAANSTGVSTRKGYFHDLFRAWKNTDLLMISFPIAFLSWGQQSLLTYYVVYMKAGGIPVIFAELLLAILLAGSVAGRLFWVNLSSIIFPKNRSYMISLIMVMAGILFFVFSRRGFPVFVSGLITFFIGMTAIGWNSTYVTIISEFAPKKDIGLYSGVSLMMVSLGTILGTPVSGEIVDILSYVWMWRFIGSGLIAMAVAVLIINRVPRTGK